MKVTDLGRIFPATGAANLGAEGGGIDGSGADFPNNSGFPPSGHVPTATGSNTWAWSSNVAGITSNGSNSLIGPFINFASGSNIIFTLDQGPFPTQSMPSNTLRIHSTGGGGSGSLIVSDEGSPLTGNATTLDFVGAGVTASGGAGTKTITIPGGSSSDGTIPSGGTLYNGTSTSGWTTFGSPDTFDANSTVADQFYLAETTFGTNNLIGVTRAVGGSFPRTYTMRLTGGHMITNFHGLSLLIAESGPGKFTTWGLVHDSGSLQGPFLARQDWTASNNGTTSNNHTSSPGGVVVVPVWLRIIVTSSSSVAFAASRDGYAYYTLASGFNPGYTVALFGFGFYTFAAIEHKMIVDWIHET